MASLSPMSGETPAARRRRRLIRHTYVGAALDELGIETARLRRRRAELELRLCREASAGPLGYHQRVALRERMNELERELAGRR